MNEIAGAILGCQLGKLPELLNRIARNTAIVRSAVQEIADAHPALHLRPANPDRDRHALGVLVYLPDAAQADAVARALRGEGVPAGKVYGGQPVYAAPQILNQWTITDGCPFNCPTFFPEPIRYAMGMCPRTEDLLGRAVSISVGPMYEEEDLEDLITGVQKVAHHLL
ncbi:MAG: DegT/DnrJ/EryC1/StrS family aminotransferase [Caldilineaceae bacterium]